MFAVCELLPDQRKILRLRAGGRSHNCVVCHVRCACLCLFNLYMSRVWNGRWIDWFSEKSKSASGREIRQSDRAIRIRDWQHSIELIVTKNERKKNVFIFCFYSQLKKQNEIKSKGTERPRNQVHVTYQVHDNKQIGKRAKHVINVTELD